MRYLKLSLVLAIVFVFAAPVMAQGGEGLTIGFSQVGSESAWRTAFTNAVQAEAEERARDILSAVNLGHRLDHKPGQLSGGEQQRVAIARSLVMSPGSLLADEPTGNLDSVTSDDILVLLDRLHAERDLTIVVVTHNEKVASRMDRTVLMEDGLLAPAFVA